MSLELNDVKKYSLSLVQRSKIAMLSTIDENSFPNVKAMLTTPCEDIKTHWFSTNTSSKRVSQLINNNKACIYFVDQEKFIGLMLIGTIEILQDPESRKRLWQAGYEMYYPLGVNDPDYSVLKFTAEKANYYYYLENITFDL